MENIVWDEKFNIGVEVVDRAHAKLFRIIKKLMDISQDPETNQRTYQEGIKYLEDYSMTHFLEEEEYMRSIKYSGYANHKRIHDNFRDKTLVQFKKEMESSGYSTTAVCRFLEVMKRWLTEHILREDQAIVGRTVSWSSYDISSKLPIISKAVNRTLMEVFQTEAKLVTSDYKGQNIGNGYYCRRVYDTEGGIRIQMLLGIEEPLIRRGINRILENEQKENKIKEADGEIPDNEEIGVLLQVFAQVFKGMSKLFRVETEYELSKDNLMTRDDFRKDFMKHYPCSLLFNGKTGYFVFCYRGWRIKKQKDGKAS